MHTGLLPQQELRSADLSRYSPNSRRLIDLLGFYTDEPPASVYGPLTPVPLDERPQGYRAPYDKLGLGGVDVDVGGDEEYASIYSISRVEPVDDGESSHHQQTTPSESNTSTTSHLALTEQVEWAMMQLDINRESSEDSMEVEELPVSSILPTEAVKAPHFDQYSPQSRRIMGLMGFDVDRMFASTPRVTIPVPINPQEELQVWSPDCKLGVGLEENDDDHVPPSR